MALVILGMALSTVPAATARAARGSAGSSRIRADLTDAPVRTLRRCVSSLAHHLHLAHHHRRHGRLAHLLRTHADVSIASAVHVRAADDDQAVQTGSTLPWLEDRLLPDPPAPSQLIADAGPSHATGLDEVERHAPRGPPLPL